MEHGMKVFILAAGVGSRLRPLTDMKPKCLVRVGGKPILAYQIEAYLESGLNAGDIIIAGGYRTDMMDAYLKNNFPGVVLIENKVYDTTNNMFSLHYALKEMGIDENEGIIINNGDCIYDSHIISGIISDSRHDTVAVHRDEYLAESMKVAVTDGIIRTISKEIPESEAFGVSIDLYRLSHVSAIKLLEIMENYVVAQNQKNLWTEVALQDLFNICDFAPFDIQNRDWIEIDNFNDLLLADRMFSKFDIGRKKCLVSDLDGTVYLGNTPIDRAVRFIQKSSPEKEFFFLTNNTSKIPDDYVERLNSMGITTDRTHIIAPHLPMIKYLRGESIDRVFLMANKRYSDFLTGEMPGLKTDVVSQSCQAVIVTFDTELTYDKLKEAALLLQNPEVKFLATHHDKVCPTENGPIPDAGSIIALLHSATGREPDKIFGKPNQELLYQVVQKYNKDDIAIIGDRLYTDKVLAENAGIDFVLVLSGESNRTDAENCELSPALILNNMGDLLE